MCLIMNTKIRASYSDVRNNMGVLFALLANILIFNVPIDVLGQKVRTLIYTADSLAVQDAISASLSRELPCVLF